LAIDDGFGENKKTNFIPIVVWGKSAESAANYLTKGSQVAINGKIQTRSYDAKDGTKKYVTEVVADQFGGVEFIGNKKENNSNNAQSMPADMFNGGGLEERFGDELQVDDSADIPF
jgi:single-strand DNA-binding protein